MRCPFCRSEMFLSNFSRHRECAYTKRDRPNQGPIIIGSEAHPYFKGEISLEKYQCDSCFQWIDKVKTDRHPDYIYILSEYRENENTH